MKNFTIYPSLLHIRTVSVVFLRAKVIKIVLGVKFQMASEQSNKILVRFFSSHTIAQIFRGYGANFIGFLCYLYKIRDKNKNC
jgi:hypothetical protein